MSDCENSVSSSEPDRYDVVGAHVEVTMAAEVEQDRPLFSRLLGRLRLLHHGADRVGGLGRRQDRLGAGELDRRGEGLVLLVGARLHQPVLDQPAHHRRVAVVAQPARVHRRRNEVVTERVHGHERGQADGVAEVVAICPAGERGAGRRLGGHETRRGLAPDHALDVGEGHAREVRAAAHAAHHHVGLGAGHLHLRHRLLADHGLVQADVVEHRAERVVAVLGLGRHLHRLGDGDPERAGGVLSLGAAGVGGVAGRADDLGAPALHHRPPVGLLVVAGADHVDQAVEIEQAAGQRQGRAPLARTGLGYEPPHAGLLVGVGLRDGAVGLVRSRR